MQVKISDIVTDYTKSGRMKNKSDTLTLFASVIEPLDDPIAVLYGETILTANRSFKNLFGLNQRADFAGISIFEIIGDEPRKVFEKILSSNNRDTFTEPIEIKCHRKNRPEIELGLKFSSAQIENLDYLIVSFHDNFEKKKILDQINKFSRVVDQSASIIMITDVNGNIEYTNPKFTEVTGYQFEEVFGKNPRFLNSDESNEKELTDMWNCVLAGKEWKGEFRNKKKNGDYYWESASITPIKNEEGIVTHILAVKEDITTKKEMEEELKRALDAAEEASRLKSTLLANMSHELRTPLTGIIGFSNLLREELQDPEHLQMTDKIIKSGKRLLATLNSILNLSEIESGNFPVSLTEFNLPYYTRYLLINYSHLAAEKNLSFNIEIKDKEICAIADENLFKQVLMHIVDNAIKFTSVGGVTVTIDSELNECGSTKAVIRIADTGIGIAKEDLSKLFREFRQISEGIRRNYEGNGLGLAVAKKMLTLLNGDITVESEPGKGSLFTIYLPGIRKLPDESSNLMYKVDTLTRPDSEIIEPNRELPFVLSIEDNRLNSELVGLFLRNVCIVEHAFNYEQAMRLLKGKIYSAVLLDINLGEGPSGIDIAKEIRRLPGYAEVPLVAITGYALLRDEKKLISEGFDYYIAKPFYESELVSIVKQIIDSN